MLNQKLVVTRDVTIQIAELEKMLDAVLVQQARLQITLVEGRRTARLPLDAGQLGLERIMQAGASLMAARGAIHEAHYDFRTVRDQLRLPVHAYGDGGDTPDSFAPKGAAEPDTPVTLVRAA